MPLDELNEKQIKFIVKYLDKGFLRSAKKDLKANAKYVEASKNVFGEVNRLRGVIAEVEQKYEHAPVDIYFGILDTYEEQARKIIKSSSDLIKRGEAPDFLPVHNGLKELEKRIGERVQQAQSGKGIDGQVDAKERYGATVLSQLQTEKDTAEKLFQRAMTEMSLATETEYGRRNIAIRGWRDMHAAALKDLSDRIEKDAHSSTVTLETLKTTLDDMLDTFRKDAKPFLEKLDTLLSAPSFDHATERGRLSTDPRYKDQPVVQGALARTDAADKEAKRLEQAIAAQKLKIEELKKAFAEARNDGRAQARAAFTAAKTQLAALQSRQQQLAAFVKGADRRGNTLVEATRRTELTEDFADRMLQQPVGDMDELGEMVEALKARPLGLVVPTNPDLVLEAIEDLREAVNLAKDKEVIVPKLMKDEPIQTELSDREATALLKLLDLATLCANDGALDKATALIERVRTEKRAFRDARLALQLPPPQPPVPEGAAAIALRVAQLQGRLRDLIAVGATSKGGREASKILDDVTALGKRVKEDDKAAKPIDTVTEEKTLDTLRDEINLLEPPAPSQGLVDARKKSAETGQQVQQLLSDLLRTEKITDKDIIEVPGKTYTKEEQARLVRVDEIIDVDVDGKIEKHKILQNRKGKGGQDLARRSDKNIPREATDDLRRKALTLQMMAEVDTPESIVAMEAYRLEIIALMTDIKGHGDTKYPQVEKIVKDCTKLLKDELTEYIPANFARLKADFEKFAGEWKTKAPSAALTEAEKHKEAIEGLVKAVGNLKEDYKKAKADLKIILADLKGKKDKKSADPLGDLMKSKLKMTPKELFAGTIVHSDDPRFAQVEQALKDFEAAQDYYAKAKHRGGGDTMSGTWKKDADAAMTKLESKEAANVDEAAKDTTRIRGEMHALAEEMNELDTADGDKKIDLLLKLVGKIKESSDADQKSDKEQIAYFEVKERVKPLIATTKDLAKSKGKNPSAKLMLDQLRGIDKQRRTASAESEADGTWRLATGTLERLERETTDIRNRLRTFDKEKGEKVKNMRLGSKPEVLDKLAKDLIASMDTLVPTMIEPLFPDPVPGDLDKAAKALAKSLKSVTLPDLGKLKTLGGIIDKANDEAEQGRDTKATRIGLREEALAEIRAFRNALENHPSIKLYRTNPFDKGTAARLVQTALHQTEIAVLASVSPHEKA